MRLGAFVAIFVSLGLGAQAASPEDEYWRARLEAMAKLRALVAEKADEKVIGEVEHAASEALWRKVERIVGAVKLEGVSGRAWSTVVLTDSPEFGALDGLSFRFRDDGSLVVTTDKLLRLWLADYPEKPRPAWTRDALRALKTDKFYGTAIETDGFDSVADFALPKPEGASFAAAKLGRWAPHTDSTPFPVLIVTVVKGHRVFIASQSPTTKAPEIADCAKRAASLEPPDPKIDSWGPLVNDGEAFKAWRDCERRELPKEPYYADLQRQAREISETLARAK